MALALARGTDIPCLAVRQAPDPQAFDLLALGFWVRKGAPDSRSQRYMARVRGKRVFLFGTLGAWPDSPQAQRCTRIAHDLLAEGGNKVLDVFLSQGRVNPRVLAATQRKGTHTLTRERLLRLREAERHPDATDCEAARLCWQRALDSARHSFEHLAPV